MVYGNALQSYRKAQVSGEADPQKLILMLYEAAIKRLHLARAGMKEGNIRKRGENIGKTIAIISELNASLDEKIRTDEINFLRSLYMTMMTELTKVAVNNNVKTIDRSIKYLTELKRIWETTVMKSPAAGRRRTRRPEGANPAHGKTPYKEHSIAV